MGSKPLIRGNLFSSYGWRISEGWSSAFHAIPHCHTSIITPMHPISPTQLEGADVDLEATAEKLSSRCLSIRKDFVVFTLGPQGSIRVDPSRLQV